MWTWFNIWFKCWNRVKDKRLYVFIRLQFYTSFLPKTEIVIWSPFIIYCPYMQWPTLDELSRAQSHPFLTRDPRGLWYLYHILNVSLFWQSLESLQLSRHCVILDKRQTCNGSVTWQWGFRDECVGMCCVKCHQNFEVLAVTSMWPRHPISCAWCFLPPALDRLTPWGARQKGWSRGA